MSTTHSTPQSEAQTSISPRQEWIVRRREHAARTGDDNVSQMHFARKGMITEEMLYVAERESILGSDAAIRVYRPAP